MQIDEGTGSATPSPGSVEADRDAHAAPTEPPAGEGSAATAVAPPVAPPTPVAPVAPKRTVPTLGGKRVVLEYDNTASTPKKPPAPVKGDDNASIGAARITYLSGNRKLFSGDADAAIKLYRQALAMYPGYVASYRGLGLAYAQKGDKANALKAFRTYINAVPGAKDVALVRKRIATLQR